MLNPSKFLSIVVIAALFLFFGCSGEKSDSKTDSPSKTAQTIDTTGALPDMSVYQITSLWTNQNGEQLQLKKLRGHIVVAVMIYTSCTSACPILVEKVRNIHDELTSEENSKITYVFISIDPKDDTPEKLKAFAKKKGMDSPQYVFLRSSLENTRTLSAVLGVSFKEVSKMNYKHSNIISVLDQNGVIKHQQKGLDVNNASVVKSIKELL